jgi:hypothetical protein
MLYSYPTLPIAIPIHSSTCTSPKPSPAQPSPIGSRGMDLWKYRAGRDSQSQPGPRAVVRRLCLWIGRGSPDRALRARRGHHHLAAGSGQRAVVAAPDRPFMAWRLRDVSSRPSREAPRAHPTDQTNLKPRPKTKGKRERIFCPAQRSACASLPAARRFLLVGRRRCDAREDSAHRWRCLPLLASWLVLITAGLR